MKLTLRLEGEGERANTFPFSSLWEKVSNYFFFGISLEKVRKKRAEKHPTPECTISLDVFVDLRIESVSLGDCRVSLILPLEK